MAEHTREPWKADRFGDDQAVAVTKTSILLSGIGTNGEADIGRAVECVNALARVRNVEALPDALNALKWIANMHSSVNLDAMREAVQKALDALNERHPMDPYPEGG